MTSAPVITVAPRLIDWPERLGAYLLAHMGAPFAWGTNDCVTFANGAHEALTGVRLALPEWADEAQARAELERRGGLEAAVDGVLPRLYSPMVAQRGDLVLMRDAGVDGAWLAVVEDDYAWAPYRRGLARRSLFDCATAAWGIGAWKR